MGPSTEIKLPKINNNVEIKLISINTPWGAVLIAEERILVKIKENALFYFLQSK